VDGVVVPPEVAEEVQGVAPALKEHRQAEEPVDRARDVECANQEDQESGDQQPEERLPVALQGEYDGPDAEAETKQVERVAQQRVPVAEEDQSERALERPGPGLCYGRLLLRHIRVASS
jgi:hypothetical protein